MAVAEAMLSGCIPVVTKAGALPEVVGDCGVYCDSTPSSIARAISEAMNMPDSDRQRARERVLINFSLQKRRASLERAISQAAPASLQMAHESAR
jgi:glycosyltransferase involved in cell wall biosynthesis